MKVGVKPKRSSQRRYSPELKEWAVRMVFALRRETGEKHGSLSVSQGRSRSVSSRCGRGFFRPRLTRVSGPPLRCELHPVRHYGTPGETVAALLPPLSVVGLGRFELPTS